MICDACDNQIEFGAVKIFEGRTVCRSCFAVLTTKSDSVDTDPAPVETTQSMIEQCQNCGQSVRVPTNQGTIRVTCPKCRSAWDWTPQAKTESTRTQQQGSTPDQSAHTVGAVSSEQNNGFATASFGLGIASVFLYQLGIVPLLGIIFGVIALSTFKDAVQKNKWMALTGLILSLIYMILSASYWATAGMTPSQSIEAKSNPTPIARGQQTVPNGRQAAPPNGGVNKGGDIRLYRRKQTNEPKADIRLFRRNTAGE